MDYINKTLLLSLEQDLYTLNESINNISTNGDLQSWLFPTKNYKFIDSFIKDNHKWKLNVKLILELIIDRLYIGLRLILMKIEENIKSDGNTMNEFKLQVCKLPQITIGCCFENLRKMIEMKTAINSNRIIFTGEVIKMKKINSGTQTYVTSMTYCDSCASAIISMKFLLDIFETAKTDILQVRRMKNNIQDLTQFGCMQLTTASIEKNLKQLVEKIMQYENENGELKDRVEMLTKQILNKNGTITLLEQENITLNDTLKKSETRQTITQNKINELQSENLEIYKEKENLKSLNDDLNSTLNVYRQVNSRLHEEKIILQENCGKTTSHIKHCIEDISELDKKLIILYRQHECFVEELNDMNKDLESLIKTFKKISKLHNEMETRIKISCGTIEDNARHITEKIKTFQVKIIEKLFAMRLNAMSAPNTNTKIQVKGNPIEDITKQIEENNEKIKTLQNENVKLESILLKFKTIKK
ncbi:uncharacterized protein LOC130893257 isoform X2 [Diorhabda carinulata]|uniref:uncharacterized protein LOC130893257 isoform X2 n=1 Tax=Diorhabda carinulata TaxID=1163345 RepID=UPI0025A2B3CD|nr:uncharacterized protein LOC130893257 isoform X2 [Diorhabda carinulata]